MEGDIYASILFTLINDKYRSPGDIILAVVDRRSRHVLQELI